VSTTGFDELIHAPTRLEIVSLLAAAQWADFKYIRDELGLRLGALQTAVHPRVGRLRRDPQKIRGQAPAHLSQPQHSWPPGLRAARGSPAENPGQVTTQWRRPAGHRGRPRDPRTLSRRIFADGGNLLRARLSAQICHQQTANSQVGDPHTLQTAEGVTSQVLHPYAGDPADIAATTAALRTYQQAPTA